MALGVLALATTSRKSIKKGRSDSGGPLIFSSFTFRHDDWWYADPDGIVVLPEQAK